MMRPILRALLCSGFLSLMSCSYFQGRLWVAMGNYNYERGNYIDSISFYNKGIDKLEFQPWIYYNLGLTYAALSENESALEMWERAKELVDQPFLFYIYYNEGLVFYYQGLYLRAFDAFKQALKINPYDREVKVNLELALEKMRNSGRNNTSSPSDKSPNANEPNQKEKDLLESIAKSEGSSWVANQKHTSSTSTEPDY